MLIRLIFCLLIYYFSFIVIFKVEFKLRLIYIVFNYFIINFSNICFVNEFKFFKILEILHVL
jgi:hypothetical protein